MCEISDFKGIWSEWIKLYLMIFSEGRMKMMTVQEAASGEMLQSNFLTAFDRLAPIAFLVQGWNSNFWNFVTFTLFSKKWNEIYKSFNKIMRRF